jgi:AcrR family transcriptional regulator
VVPGLETGISGVASTLRNEPVQARSAARLAALLDATAEVLDEVGYERLTTAMIAERAGASIGTVYRYFPDRLAVLQALGRRNLASFQAELGERFAEHAPQHWSAVVDALLALLEQRFASEPGFRSIRFGDVIDLGLQGDRPEGGDQLAGQLAELLGAAGLALDDELRFRARFALQYAESGMALAFRTGAREEEAIRTAGATLTGYLRHFYA